MTGLNLSADAEIVPNPKADWLQKKRLHGLLPNFVDKSKSEAEGAIIRAAGLYEGDHATAGVLLSDFVAGAAITVRRDGARLLYSKADRFPEFVDRSPGSPAFNAELERRSEMERRSREQSSAEVAKRQREDYLKFNPEARMLQQAIQEALIPIKAQQAADAERAAALEAQVSELTQSVADLAETVARVLGAAA